MVVTCLYTDYPDTIVKRICCLCGLLCLAAFPLCAQDWTKADSLRLQQLLQSEGEIILNLDILKEVDESPLGSPRAVESKPWLEVDETLPAVQGVRPRKVKLTLFPYTANTPYNWDPVKQCKIKIDENTWRNDPFYELKTKTVYSDWAKSPLDAGPRETLEQIEATGLRYVVQGRVANQSVFGWQAVGRPSGYSLMPDKGALRIRARKRRARTLEVLRTYADSTRIEPKKPLPSEDTPKP